MIKHNSSLFTFVFLNALCLLLMISCQSDEELKDDRVLNATADKQYVAFDDLPIEVHKELTQLHATKSNNFSSSIFGSPGTDIPAIENQE
ncbi:hypothetical protein DSM03_1011227 [Leeuwenhoekiella aestuarii]|uniref:Uncharacterized protein n=1 Tax=Leeuwenhoekiella aestuarii TaxID=2249426 RepID=A0A4Q0P1L0_9FLAO|nr:hypothetical protein [Leeuwenhoekiella aestuarii]RXG18536.1 hypothetical protein DSM04_101738 [Leeuwenhoekiella aestuarii]RXG19841.1 hypothetical protein DSM03_1011227 [Leeuwenhoekiella aestuarii]